MLHSAGHLLAPDGMLLALKGQLQRDEITALPDGFTIADVHALRVPGLAAARHAVIIRRTQAVQPRIVEHGHAA
jgi:16S rRNA (guanine527-N7)-methyltransferase